MSDNVSASLLYYFFLHHFPCSLSYVPVIILLLQIVVWPNHLHKALTTQTCSSITSTHNSSIFHRLMKYAWICALHLPSLELHTPQEACLICKWMLCWINQQLIYFLVEMTIRKKKKKTVVTAKSSSDPSMLLFVCCYCLLMVYWDSGGKWQT